jgi:hypothetical protein
MRPPWTTCCSSIDRRAACMQALLPLGRATLVKASD